MNPTTPVVVGVGQLTNRTGDPATSPLDMMEATARSADADAGASVLSRIDSVQVVNLMTAQYVDPAAALATRLGIPEGERLYTTVGGNTPQLLVEKACDAIVRGTRRAVLISGAEAFVSMRRARQDGIELDRPGEQGPCRAETVGDPRNGLGPAENAVGIMMPVQMYPIFESALAARAGRSMVEQREWLGRLMAPFTQVAASHPDLAWFPVARTPEELSTVTAENRYICEPYPKLLNSIIAVEQSASIIVCAAEVAEVAGVPRDRWVFPWSAASAHDVFFPAERPNLHRSEGIAAAGRLALEAAQIGIDDVAMFDLYSCFPSAVQMGAEALGIALDDSRGLTVTGGLPYFGGPGNNYVSHSIAVMVDRCREDPKGIGLLTGLGWYTTKHSIGIYSSALPRQRFARADAAAEQARIDAMAVAVAGNDDLDGEAVATVEAMTVVHDRDAGPVSAPAFLNLDDGRRVVAALADSTQATALSEAGLVGQKVKVRAGASAPVYEPA